MAKSPNEFTIFYAWQSDTSANHNRHLIEESLQDACARLGAKDSIPFVITITSDTKGVPGFCDIPAAILAKIEAADAVVLDLTFIAKTSSVEPKDCPNPNVLFELGYAFHAVGCERLICVMNEAHGPANEMLFDVAHRRHPVRYTCPADNVPRSEVVARLANALTDALEPTVLLGPRSAGKDDEREFQREISLIRSHWASRQSEKDVPMVFFSLRPRRYSERRWPDADELEKVLRRHQVLIGRHFVPPSDTRTDVMQWGLYNGTYGTPSWALTYSGIFWAAIKIGAHGEYVRSPRDNALDPTVDGEQTIAAGKWLNYMYVRGDVSEVFQFAGSFASAFAAKEQLIWSAEAEGLSGTCLAANHNVNMWSFCSRKCASQGATRGGVASAEEFGDDCIERCVDFLYEMVSMFDLHGPRIKRETLQEYFEPNGQH